jgi:hypothetical protein
LSADMLQHLHGAQGAQPFAVGDGTFQASQKLVRPPTGVQ